ncbi:MAG: TonB-dependent receptor [Ignavibacteria bacterium]|nr:TonB-dependent receptor [Ignavibacteria bacterium]
MVIKYSLKMIAAIVLMVLTTSLYGQSGVGKLAGKVVDEATKEPLIGANIVLVNTELGAASDVNGNYYVLNITPGTYTVQISYIGYGKKIFKDVRIVAGITYELNVELSSNYQLDQVVVTAKKLFEEKATNTVKVLDADQINKLPVKGVEKLVGMTAGVVMLEGSGGASGNAVVNVRGGRGGEVVYIVDGVPQNDIYNGANTAQVSNGAIDQISFQVGGYEAKYGQAQSGIVNVTTKSGTNKYTFFTDLMTSSFTDDYGYNLYSANFGGPFVPGNAHHTFFLSAERGYFLDGRPSARGVVIPSANINSKTLPGNDQDVWRFTGKTYHNFEALQVRLGANVNFRNYRTYVQSYAKSNSDHNPRIKDENYSYNARLSQSLSNSAAWNLNLGYTLFNRKRGDGVFFDNIDAYGDTIANKALTLQGSYVGQDANKLFFAHGSTYSSGFYERTRNSKLSADFDFTNQFGKHLVEFGAGVAYHTIRYYLMNPARAVAIDNAGPNSKSLLVRSALALPTMIGFDATGQTMTDSDVDQFISTDTYTMQAAPKHPLVGYGYIQDKYELNDLVINVGLRFDYFASKADVLKNESMPIYGGLDSTRLDKGDLKIKDPEVHFSPRIGVGFPVTTSTVFHAMYGRFIQEPSLQDIYTNYDALKGFETAGSQLQGVNTGNLSSEVTTQYEIGFRQLIANGSGMINLTAFYKNTVGLVNDDNIFWYTMPGSARGQSYGPENTDFGTVKGIALALSVNKISYFSFNLDYTYSLAEGTGSSTTSSQTAAFRNSSGETPKVIAPLDFDQRHTGVLNIDFTIPENENNSILRAISANLIFSFQSGRPYTPLLQQDITPGGASNLGETKGYVNSSYMPGSSRIDLRVEKRIFADNFTITPYVVVENLLNSENIVNVFRSTGSATTTGYLNTTEGAAKAASNPNYASDYMALEHTPINFGIPRLIKLGIKVNFTGSSM